MRPAPVSRAAENATSTTTIAVVNLLSRMPVPVRPPSRSTRMTSGRDARIAGTIPASTADSTATAPRKERNAAVDGERPPQRRGGLFGAVNGDVGEMQGNGGEHEATEHAEQR